RVHHLNCGSLCPHGRRLINGDGGIRDKAEIVCHCLAIETGDGLLLVDTGFGLEDARNPAQLGGAFRTMMNPRPKEETTALRRLEALNFAAADVRQIVTTHLDLDHAGGLPDFPAAEVHVLSAELDAALHPALSDKLRYIGGAHWRHDPRWVRHEGGGDEWFGFEGIRILPGTEAEVLLIPLLGHSRGHTGVAIRDGDGWLLHCGDSYFNHGEMQTPPSCPPVLRFFQNMTASDNKARKANQERLRELADRHGDEVTLFCAHDPHELKREQARATAASAAG
ncbi:MAG TPA: MBL fold metallo-hydrolase, partial [Solirubrobacterales bacterium]|nr:MBL fold metallo-hydrolase [Solirubrobacterales bacterium]